MSGHEKPKPQSRHPRSGVGKSPIAQPPRAALRSKANASDREHADETASIHSTNGEDGETSSMSPAERIAELEREVATMTSEFSAELESLSHKLTNESETAVFWQQKHSSLNQTFLKADTDLRLLRQEVGTFTQGREERERDVKTRINSLMLDRDAFREAYNEAMGELRVKEDMITSLQGQVRGLKSFVSTSGKMDEQVTDEAFGERMQRLGNGLQNWVITNFRRCKIDTEKADGKTKEQLLQLVPTYESLASSSKVHLIQSLISRLLVEHIFSMFFVGLPEEAADELKKAEKYLSGFGSTESMNQWRSATLAILRKEAEQKLQSETTSIVERVLERFNSIMGSIGDTQHNESRDNSLKPLILSSIDLSRLLGVQKAVFTVEMPSIEGHQKTMFDSDTMEDIGGEDEDTLHERELKCVTFPGIIKNGDENGERSHLRNVVARIRVLCSPD